MIRACLLVFTTLFILVPFSLDAQLKEGFCGAHVHANQKSLMMRGVPGYFGCNVINRIERTLQISLHICLDVNQQQGITQADLDGALDRINSDFSPCGLQFEYCALELMENDRFDSLTVFDNYNEEVQMTSIYYEPNTINIYLVDTIGLQGFADVNGYAVFPGGIDIIVIEKAKFNADDLTATHEMGHFFGLYHTFETDNGIELANGSNCDIAGDLVCDTEADPSQIGQANVDDQCNYDGPTPQDSNGDWYVPPTDNYMSYYPPDCVCRFTPQQYNRMIEQYLSIRFYLW